MRIVIAGAHAPFTAGVTAERAAGLMDELRRRGHDVESVSLPLNPDASMAAQAAAWRLLDLRRSNLRPIDLLIATRFPAYCARHPNKVAWLVQSPGATPLPPQLIDLDAKMLAECRVVAADPPAPGAPWDTLIEQLLG